MTHPADGHSKLLLVLGRDGDDLKAAADALVLGHAALSGAVAQVRDVRAIAPRPAYDAPGWVRIDRAMKLGELIDWPQQLQASGRPPQLDPIRVSLRIPPDLVAWRGPGVPFALRFHYTPPACAGESHLDVSINDELLKVVPLRAAAAEAIAGTTEVLIPAFGFAAAASCSSPSGSPCVRHRRHHGGRLSAARPRVRGLSEPHQPHSKRPGVTPNCWREAAM